MTCPVVLFGQTFAKKATTPTTNRYYAWRLMKRAGVHVMGICSEPWMGVCHADELFYLFSIPDQRTAEERRLSRDMIRAWTSFARSGQPGVIGPKSVQWTEAFDRNDTSSFTTRHMALDPRNYSMIEGFWKTTCDDFWRQRIFV